jgi:4-oxalocrotonate tautomerase family enzyme
MPFVHIEIAEGYSPEVHRELHRQLAAAVSDLLTAPLRSIRTSINEHQLTNSAVGGVPLSDFDSPAGPDNPAGQHDLPYVYIQIVEGRTPDAKAKWQERTAQIVAELLDVPLHIVHTGIIEWPVNDFGIAGVPFSIGRKEVVTKLQQLALETELRQLATDPR